MISNSINVIKCGIYKLFFHEHPKCYIGSSVNIYERFQNHLTLLRTNKHCNIHLQRIYNKIGKMSIEILEECPEKFLFQQEEFYINQYKDIAVNINFNCGRGPRTTKSVILKNYLTNEIISEKSHLEFEQKHQLRRGGVTHLKTNYNKICGDFCLPEYEPPHHIIKSPTQTLEKVYKHRIKQFAIDHHLDPNRFEDVLNNKLKHHKGWSLPTTEISTQAIPKIPNRVNIVRKYCLISPTNQLCEFFNLPKFAIENQLDIGKLREVIYKNQKEHKGWRSPYYKSLKKM